MSLVALFVFQLAKLHIFKEKHNKMTSFFAGVVEDYEDIASFEVNDNGTMMKNTAKISELSKLPMLVR